MHLNLICAIKLYISKRALYMKFNVAIMLDHHFHTHTVHMHPGVVFLISTLSVLISLVQTRRHRQQLHDMVVSSSTVTVMRDGKGGLRQRVIVFIVMD